MMKKIIGSGILLSISTIIHAVMWTCTGFKAATFIWFGSIALAALIFLAVKLIFD